MFELNDRIMKLVEEYDNKDEILSTLQSLSPDEELAVLAKLLGFTSVPPTITEFIHDPYYLGNIYGQNLFPIWEERLNQVFPDPIRTPATVLVAKGAIGTGKSRFSTIVCLYDLCKYCLLESPSKTLQLDPTTIFTIRFFNVNLVKANETFINPIQYVLNHSPFFKEIINKYHGLPGGIRITSGSKVKHALSEAMISCVISETNFFGTAMAKDLISTVLSRLDSRMQAGVGFLNHVILDSSDTNEDSVVESFIKDSPYASKLMSFSTTIWEAKSHLGIYFNRGSFDVYAGDAETAPFIIPDTIDVATMDKLDKDRIIKCPNEVRDSFELDIYKALQEKCGISIKSSNIYFPQKDILIKSFELPLMTKEIMIFDFFDHEAIYPSIKDAINKLPEDRRLYVRIDMGVAHDHCGFAITHYDGDKQYKDSDGQIRSYSTYKTPICFALSRKAGQETAINKVRDLVISISSVREIASVSTDQFQSTQLRQELTQEGIKTKLISVDRTDTAYVIYKSLVLMGRHKCVDNSKLKWELLNLQRFGSKIDHKAGFSKDQSDAMVGSVYDCYMDGKAAADIPTQFASKKLGNILDTVNRTRNRYSNIVNPWR